MKQLYLITATTDTEGLVLNEIFEDVGDALAFERDGVKRQLREHYGDSMADAESLSIGFHSVILHESEKKLNYKRAMRFVHD